MTFNQWFFGENKYINPGFDNPNISMQWKLPHILVLLTCIIAVVLIALIFRKKDEKSKKIVMWVLAGAILSFEIVRRMRGFYVLFRYERDIMTLSDFLYTLLPRPWCAISCWFTIIAVIVKKRYVYNMASIMGILCAVIFFAYPSAGFNNEYMEFENIYSIATHALFFVSSISFITLGYTNFKYKEIKKDLICLALVFIYASFEIWVLDISSNPLYFLPADDNEVQNILGLGNVAYVIVYFLFLAVWVNSFYLIDDRNFVFKKIRKIKNN